MDPRHSVTVSGVIPQIWGIRRLIGERIWVIGDSPTSLNSSPNLGYFDENWGMKIRIQSITPCEIWTTFCCLHPMRRE